MEFKEKVKSKNIYLLSTKANKVYTDIKYEDDSYLVFGPETRGLPEEYILDNFENTVRIPMKKNIINLIIMLEQQSILLVQETIQHILTLGPKLIIMEI